MFPPPILKLVIRYLPGNCVYVVRLSLKLEIDVDVANRVVVRSGNVIFQRRRRKELDAVVNRFRARPFVLRHGAQNGLEQILDGVNLDYLRDGGRFQEKSQIDVLDSGESDACPKARALSDLSHFSVAQ